jgi:uncharacterized membrane protein
MMKKINQTFFRGLIVVLPITLTFFLLYWASAKAEGIFGSVVLWAVGQEFYLPGTGIILTVVFIFLVGLMAHSYLTGRIFQWFMKKLEEFPLIKVIYNPLKDLMALLPGRSDRAGHQSVVLIEYGGVQVMGFVTRDEMPEIPIPNLITVYVPFSYMLGGLTLIVQKDKAIKVDMPVDQAIKLSVTAWIKAKSN